MLLLGQRYFLHVGPPLVQPIMLPLGQPIMLPLGQRCFARWANIHCNFAGQPSSNVAPTITQRYTDYKPTLRQPWLAAKTNKKCCWWGRPGAVCMSHTYAMSVRSPMSDIAMINHSDCQKWHAWVTHRINHSYVRSTATT